MKIQPHGFDDDLVKRRIREQIPQCIFIVELGTRGAQLNIRAVFSCFEINFVGILAGSYEDEQNYR